MLPVSILDQTPITKNQTSQEALKQTIELAQLADQLGYTRYLVAEHHNLKDVIGTSPEILTMHLLNQTKDLRIGSGGVMLQHYHPLKIIEQFHLMDELSNHRVDLAVGKAPGGYPKVIETLKEELKEHYFSFDEKFEILNRLNTQNFDNSSKYAGLKTAKRQSETSSVPVYLLGTSLNSVIQAAEAKVGVIYAFFINAEQEALEEALEAYKSRFPEGRFIVSIPAMVTAVGDNQLPFRFSQRHFELISKDGRRTVLNTKAQVDDYLSQTDETFEVTEKRMHIISGNKEEVQSKLDEINRKHMIDEWMLHMPIPNHKLRMNTVRQLAPTN